MKNKLMGISLIFAILFGAGIWYSKVQHSSKSQQELSRQYTIETGNIHLTMKSTGTVQPENRLEIKPPIAGRIESVLVKEGQHIRKGQILAWMSSTERAAVLDAARAQGTEEVKKWEDLYRATPISSPINGTLIARKVEPGQTFTSSDPILVVSDRLTVTAQVDETDLAKVKQDMPATVILDAYSETDIPAKVSRIAFEAKTVSNVTMYPVDVTPLEAPDFMRSGMTASVVFQLNSRENILLIPNDAILTKNGKYYARTKQNSASDSTPRLQEITLGVTDGKVTEILSGLSAGTTVIAPRLSEERVDNQSANPFMPSRRPPQKKPGSSNRGGGSQR